MLLCCVRAAAAERVRIAESEEALLRGDAALLREFTDSDRVTVDGTVICATCAPTCCNIYSSTPLYDTLAAP